MLAIMKGNTCIQLFYDDLEAKEKLDQDKDYRLVYVSDEMINDIRDERKRLNNPKCI